MGPPKPLVYNNFKTKTIIAGHQKSDLVFPVAHLCSDAVHPFHPFRRLFSPISQSINLGAAKIVPFETTDVKDISSFISAY